MRLLHRKLFAGLAVMAVSAGLALFSPVVAQASNGATLCAGGPIAAGTYSNLVITGTCLLTTGDVSVTKNLTVAPGATLYAMFGSSNLTVDGNLAVQSGAVLVLGCEPEAFPCFDDGHLTTNDHIFGNLDAEYALAVITHHVTVDHNLTLYAGGGGYTCENQIFFGEAPAYADFEDDTVGGQASISNWTSCWLGLYRNHVGGSVSFNYNDTAFPFEDSDTNEISSNVITANLNCVGNSPPPHADPGQLNTVGGKATGQCSDLI